jgi:hypothetical protein
MMTIHLSSVGLRRSDALGYFDKPVPIYTLATIGRWKRIKIKTRMMTGVQYSAIL